MRQVDTIPLPFPFCSEKKRTTVIMWKDEEIRMCTKEPFTMMDKLCPKMPKDGGVAIFGTEGQIREDSERI
ncbi:hypothetical protein BLNAU_1600 [Blattamonas nauphoetae]|uniref:Uncharacterized protein n=1 Tax=Blattamonas nauphoetae TaxID=2049346 RepID=A0ABQ9X3J7_9EUKA|nr:hypothetical protein BLNAU_20299 [Blattamonas nauphoetae]KAK2944875.1 hypothetical protein BLNAU_20218 [Blattamonas nauphoetae]KAK2953596.1 hypothetical protein BLNAU_11460 [Blattamonas nauphoetae]KAK2958137.1 hypothetical protein BLNAU_6841 [Blattamonas nauphoetae]KAK2963557.1 hypothetical protein BLNAU_1600 [Blattamonas nauphoetae]